MANSNETIIGSILPVIEEVKLDFINKSSLFQVSPGTAAVVILKIINNKDTKLHGICQSLTELWKLEGTNQTNFRAGFGVGFKVLNMQAQRMNKIDLPQLKNSSEYIKYISASGHDSGSFLHEIDSPKSLGDTQYYEAIDSYGFNHEAQFTDQKFIRLGGLALYDVIRLDHQIRAPRLDFLLSSP